MYIVKKKTFNPLHTTKEYETIKLTTSGKEEIKICISHFLATH